MAEMETEKQRGLDDWLAIVSRRGTRLEMNALQDQSSPHQEAKSSDYGSA